MYMMLYLLMGPEIFLSGLSDVVKLDDEIATMQIHVHTISYHRNQTSFHFKQYNSFTIWLPLTDELILVYSCDHFIGNKGEH